MTKETKKIYIDQLGHDPHVRRLVAEVPVTWTDEEVECLSGRELANRFWLEGLDWENTGDPVVEQDEIKVVDDAPDDSVADVLLAGDPPTPTALASARSNAPQCGSSHFTIKGNGDADGRLIK